MNELPLEMVGSLVVTLFMLVLTRMQTTVLTFFSFWVIMFGYINTGESIGIAFSTLVSHAGLNIAVMSAVVNFSNFFFVVVVYIVLLCMDLTTVCFLM